MVAQTDKTVNRGIILFHSPNCWEHSELLRETAVTGGPGGRVTAAWRGGGGEGEDGTEQ